MQMYAKSKFQSKFLPCTAEFLPCTAEILSVLRTLWKNEMFHQTKSIDIEECSPIILSSTVFPH